jgi:mono/diheme cytochrome c family protein
MRRLAQAGSLLLFVACGPSEPSQPPAATPPAPAPAPAPVEAPAATPPAAAAPSAAADPARGAAQYQLLCASCHGPRGAGDGPAGQNLVPRPARHDDGAYMNALSNEHLFRVIKEGGAAVGKSPMMAPWGGALSDAQIWDVVAHLRTLAVPPYSGPQP